MVNKSKREVWLAILPLPARMLVKAMQRSKWTNLHRRSIIKDTLIIAKKTVPTFSSFSEHVNHFCFPCKVLSILNANSRPETIALDLAIPIPEKMILFPLLPRQEAKAMLMLADFVQPVCGRGGLFHFNPMPKEF